MRIKILSDGTAAGTKVVDAETGQVVPGVQMINFMATTDGACEAMLHVVGVSCEIVCDARATLLPEFNPYEAKDLPDDEDPRN